MSSVRSNNKLFNSLILSRLVLMSSFTLLLVVFLAGCGTTADNPSIPASTGTTLQIVTSISPLADLIQNVGGNKVAVTSLIKPGNDPHDYEPKPTDLKLLTGAQVFFANGAGEEPFLTKMVEKASSPTLQVVTLSDGLEIISGNPHLWLTARNASFYVEKIQATLSNLSPADAKYFKDNAEKYQAELNLLDQEIRTKIQTIPQAQRIMIVFHDAFPYYAKEYGLEFKYVVKNSEAEPSAKEYADLINYIKQNKAKAVFGEAGFNPKLSKQLAQDSGAEFVNNLYDDTISTDSEADTYIKMMRLNTDTIVKALK